MKKVGFIRSSFLVFSFLLLVALPAADQGLGEANECVASFEFPSSRLHVPCFSFNGQLYWLDLSIISANPVQLQLTNYGVASSVIDECIASFPSNTLHVPCFGLNNQFFWFDLSIISTNPIQLQLTNYGVAPLPKIRTFRMIN